MIGSFGYDVFISFSHLDMQRVQLLFSKLENFGLKVFWSEKSITSGIPFSEKIQRALMDSQHFILFYTKDASTSDWVTKEWTAFHNECHIRDKENRRMYILRDEDCPEDEIPTLLKDIQRPKSADHLITELINYTIATIRGKTDEFVEGGPVNLPDLKQQLEQENRKLKEAQDYYRHYRFWRPIADNGNVHIFTCGRDIPEDPTSARGIGGRTNIDVWDYRSVLDINHFFALRYPNTKITVEDPTSKLHGSDIEDSHHRADSANHMRSKLEDKDCIIIGSPDVSDFAEITLARIHQIEPYSKGRKKKKGFVIIKEKKHTISSFYWQKEGDERDGVAQIIGLDQYEYFYNESPSGYGRTWKTYGILIVAKNPFGNEKRKIIMLSGFSGIATNAIAKLITDEAYLPEFFKLDYEYAHLDNDIEALVGIEYNVENDFTIRDTREIKRISFEKLVEI